MGPRTGTLSRRTALAAAAALGLGSCGTPPDGVDQPPSEASQGQRSPRPGTANPTSEGTQSKPTATQPSATAPSASTPSASTPSASTPSKPETATLPRGGTELFPDYRAVGYCGYPGAHGQGRLGIGKLDARVSEIEERYAKPYGKGRPILPVMELIAVTALADPGSDGRYRNRTRSKIIDRHHEVARKARAYLLLNIQPGQAKFLTEVKRLRRWLQHPDVGIALDPEWAVSKGQVPGQVYGSTTGAELDEVADWLARLVKQHQLPEKLMVYHQLHPDIVADESDLKAHAGVAVVKSVDGIGSRAAKEATWRRLAEQAPKHVRMGFKLFYSEDTAAGHPLMTPAQVMALKPRPDYVMYE